MRKQFLLVIAITVTVIFTAVAPPTVYGQGRRWSQIKGGNKPNSEVRKSVEIFSTQISEYEELIHQLQANIADNLNRYEKSQNDEAINRYAGLIQHDSAKIAEYEKKISDLENRRDQFIANAAGNPNEDNVILRAKDPVRVAQAQLYLDYYNNKASSGSTLSETGGPLKGVVVNESGYSLTTRVTGENFAIEFVLKPHQTSPFFDLPAPGTYTTTSTDGYRSGSITKPVGPNITYYINNSKGEMVAVGYMTMVKPY